MGEKHTHEVALDDRVRMPLLGFGTAGAGYEHVRFALETGYRHLDTATAYDNEEQVGRALLDSRLDRRDVFLVTKLPPQKAGRERETIAASLRALRTDYVDLWLVHAPPRGRALRETWQALLAVRDDGLARAVGVSNYSIEELDHVIEATGQAPAVNQIPWSPSRHDPRLLSAHDARGVMVEGYSPLKGTDLNDPVLLEIAAGHRVTAAQVVLRWHIEHGIPAIPKSATRARIASNLDLFSFSLSREEMERIDGLAGH